MLLNRSVYKRQQGMTLITWLILMAIIGFLVLIVLKMFPIYTKHYRIKSSLESLGEEQSLYEMRREEVLNLLDKRMQFNMVEGFQHDHFTITLKDNGNKEFRINYEDRRNIMANVDVVVKFDDVIVVSRSGAIY